MYDPERYAELGRDASRQYLPALLAICPEGWSDQRKLEVAEMILATSRGLLADLRTSGDTARACAPGSRPWPGRWSGKRRPGRAARPESGAWPRGGHWPG